MTKCTNCDKDHEVEIELDNIELKKPQTPKMQVKEIEGEPSTEPQKEKIVTKTEYKIPSHIPSSTCANGSCGKNHPNKNYQNAPNQKCENCGQFSFDSKNCPFCGNEDFEEIDKEMLDELGIPLPQVHDHDHDHEE